MEQEKAFEFTLLFVFLFKQKCKDRKDRKEETDLADNLTKEQRHRNMSHIRSVNSKPEEIVRKYLFKRGLRYRKNDRRLPGTPDLVFPKYRIVVFVHGCFWHHHDCERFKWPASNQDYWEQKITTNEKRDLKNKEALESLGWRVLIVWECQLKKPKREATLNNLYHAITDLDH